MGLISWLPRRSKSSFLSLVIVSLFIFIFFDCGETEGVVMWGCGWGSVKKEKARMNTKAHAVNTRKNRAIQGTLKREFSQGCQVSKSKGLELQSYRADWQQKWADGGGGSAFQIEKTSYEGHSCFSTTDLTRYERATHQFSDELHTLPYLPT